MHCEGNEKLMKYKILSHKTCDPLKVKCKGFWIFDFIALLDKDTEKMQKKQIFDA